MRWQSVVAAAQGRTDPDSMDWLGDANWSGLGYILVTAMVVSLLAARFARARARAGEAKRPDFDLEVAKLEALPLSTIAEARAGAVRLRGLLSSANESLGPRACVYHNRRGASRHSAVAPELVLLRDESGQAAIEGLELARVIAPKDPRAQRSSQAPDTISLYLGDEVEVLGDFRPETHGSGPLAERVYGVLGEQRHVQVRLLARASVAAEDPSTPPQSEAAPSPLASPP